MSEDNIIRHIPSLRVAVKVFGQIFYEDELDPKSWKDLLSLVEKKKEDIAKVKKMSTLSAPLNVKRRV